MRRQHAAHQRFQLVELAQRVELHAVNRAPLHEALGIGRERAQPRLAAIGNHQHLVELEQVGDLLFVGLNLVVSLPDAGLLVGRVLQLQQHQRQAVDEQHNVGPARVVRAFEGELVDRPIFVA